MQPGPMETLRAVLPPSSPLLPQLERRAQRSESSRVGSDDSDDAASASESDAVSLALSAMSVLDAEDVVPIDSERYARICARIERLQRAVGKRDVKAREAKAKLREQRRCIRSMRSELASLRVHADSLSSCMTRETAAKAEAVDRAAAALVQCERLHGESEQLRRRERLAGDQLKTQHSALAQMGDQLLNSSEETRGLRAQLSAAEQEKTALEKECRGVRAELDSQQRRVSELSQRNSALARQVEGLREVNDRCERQLEVLGAQLVQSEEARQQLQHALGAEQEESKRHVAHLLQTLIKTEDDLEIARERGRRGDERSRELRESNGMLREELLHGRLGAEAAKQAITRHQEQLQAATREHHEVARQCRELEESRRCMLGVFALTRKRLSSIDAAMAQLCVEIQRVSKTVAVGRYREAALGQALREYGRRNRELQVGLGAAKQKLRVVASALQSSEKRKSVAVASSANLKRNLVVEKCQRSELLQQCRELAACLDRCQGVAGESQARADSLNAENEALQLAVQQLVAYAQALAQSQRSLQRELTHLEVVGRREPAVFG